MQNRTKSAEGITQVEYQAFQEAFDFFNTELFHGILPQLVVVLTRKANSKGYFAPERFSSRLGKDVVHELALNPDCFTGRTDEEILSTLAHEMTHLWQQAHGTPSRRTYHNREWANKMKAIGLQPTHTGEVGGNEVGQSMTHYIVAGGPYAKAYAKLKTKGFQLHWQSTRFAKDAKRKPGKTTFTCTVCGQNAWGKPGLEVICGVCYKKTTKIVVMETQPETPVQAEGLNGED